MKRSHMNAVITMVAKQPCIDKTLNSSFLSS